MIVTHYLKVQVNHMAEGESRKTFIPYLMHYNNFSFITMPKPQCPECHKTFARKSTMELHMESVHLEAKHKCSICDKDFSTKGPLNRHINDVH